MLKLLVPVDGSEASQRAADYVIRKMQLYKDGIDVHLLNVQPQLPYGGHVSSAVGHTAVDEYHKEEGAKALAPVRQKLDAAGIKYHYHIAVGDPAQVIARYTQERGIDQILMGRSGHGAVSDMLLGSVAAKALELVDVPVVLVK